MNTLSEHEIRTFTDILSDLIGIASVKGEPEENAPYGQAPRAALQYFLDRAAQDGFTVANIGDKAGYVQWGDHGPLLGILAHLDVVPEGSGWKTDAFKLTITDTHFIGRGVVDDKGPAVCAYMAMLRFKENHPQPDFRVRLILGTDEEHGSSCMERYCETEELPDIGFTPDAEFPCIFAEKGIYHMHFESTSPSAFNMQGGEAYNMVMPSCSLTVAGETKQVKGLQAHASHPDLGINAMDLMLDEMPTEMLSSSPILLLIRKYFSKRAATPFKSFFEADLSGQMTSNVGLVNIDESHSSVCLDIRFPVTLPEENVRTRLQEIASEFSVSAIDDNIQPPLFKDKESKQISILTNIYDRYRTSFEFEAQDQEARDLSLAEPSSAIAIGGGTYARCMPNIVAFGPQLPWGEDSCHQANEMILKKNLYLLVPMYKEALEELGKIIN